jgi:hypothetical protein
MLCYHMMHSFKKTGPYEGILNDILIFNNSNFFCQLDAQILYFDTFIILLYMFRALLCSSSGGQIVLVQHLVSSLSLGDCSVHSLQEDVDSSRNLCTEQSPIESDNTGCCTIAICPPEDEHKSARNM